MRILHCCLSNFFIDNYGYQENLLTRQNKIDGHEVQILASTETYFRNTQLGYVSPSRYFDENGIEVIRIPYNRNLPHAIAKKVRHYEGTIQHIKHFAPDVILFHGASAYELVVIAKYVADNPGVKLYVDSHEDFHNSARNILSRELLHKPLYRRWVHMALPRIEKILCLSLESYDFINLLYGVPSDKLELYPLGGTIVDGEEYTARRSRVRMELRLEPTDTLFVSTGKMSKPKRISEMLRAFRRVPNESFQLLLIGSIPDETRAEIEQLAASDPRVNLVGWKSKDELLDFLCAADMYMQPGTQSATMQSALCCGCPVMLFPYKSHEMYLKGNGFFVTNESDIVSALQTLEASPRLLEDMRKASRMVASEVLDNRKLASRLYE